MSQPRCGKSRYVGEWRPKAGLTQDASCRWCKLANESVEHLFKDCQNRTIRKLRRERGIKGSNMMMKDGKVAVEFVEKALGLVK